MRRGARVCSGLGSFRGWSGGTLGFKFRARGGELLFVVEDALDEFLTRKITKFFGLNVMLHWNFS